jgi:iron complex outermembrane recepter protein
MLPFRYWSALLGGAGLLAVAASTYAQTTPAQAPTASTAQSANNSTLVADNSTQVSEVVVTGSRVIKNGNSSPTPVTVMPVDELESLRPGPVAEVLSSLPVFSGSRVADGNPGNGATNAGANVLNLRNLGFYRTLVLFDGHRVPPSTYDQLVDVDMIPQMLLQRVDVVTGGASAVYGSDAISGVVNFITDTKFNGVKVNVEGGIANQGDDATADVGLAFGHSFLDGRGHFEASYEYHNDPGVLRRSDRQWGRDVWTVQGGGTAANPYHLVENTRISNTSFGGLVGGKASSTNPLGGMNFATDGVASPFVNGAATGTNGFQSGGDGAYYDGSIKNLLDSHQVFGRGDFDFTDTLKGYSEASVTLNHSLNYGQYNQISNDTLSGQNAFLPAAYQYPGTFTFSKVFADMPRIDTNTHQTQYFINTGLRGQFGSGYNWDVSYTRSAAHATTANDANINNQNLAAALDVVGGANGPECYAATVSSAYSNCVPLNVFGPTSESAAAMAYITQKTQFTTDSGLDDLSASLVGSPFGTWAGPVTTAVSSELRRQTYEVTSDAQPTQLANCANVGPYNCKSTTPLYGDTTLATRTPVHETVAEGALEAELPLLKAVPFARDVSFNGAARFARYSVSGSAWTWKTGLVWNVDDQWKLRATRSHDFRAPTLYDLYQPTTVSTTAFSDNLTGGLVPATVYTGGNVNLKPETGDTTSAGFVFSPTWLPRFSVSVDGYYIKVTNAITTSSGYSPAAQNVCYASGGTSPYCSLQTRALGSYTNTSPANFVTAWYSTTVNISSEKTYGLDLEANYGATVLNNPLRLRTLMTWQPHIIIATPGLDTVDQGGSGYNANNLFPAPAIRATITTDYQVSNFNIAVLEQVRSKIRWTNDPAFVFSNAPIPPAAYTALTLTYQLSQQNWGGGEVFLNIQNLFNTQPTPLAGSQANANVGTFGGFALGDDPIGRYFTLGVRFRY